MSVTKLTLLALGSIAAAAAPVTGAKADLVSKVFNDGAYLPRVYDEAAILHRYGEGESSVDDVGLIRRRYWDPSTALEVVITSNPDVAASVRTVDEIRVSAIATGPQSVKETEILKGLNLKGVIVGDPESKGRAPQRITAKPTFRAKSLASWMSRSYAAMPIVAQAYASILEAKRL